MSDNGHDPKYTPGMARRQMKRLWAQIDKSSCVRRNMRVHQMIDLELIACCIQCQRMFSEPSPIKICEPAPFPEERIPMEVKT